MSTINTVDCNPNDNAKTTVCGNGNGVACTADVQCASTYCGTDADGDLYFSANAGHTGWCQAVLLPYTDPDDNPGPTPPTGRCADADTPATTGSALFGTTCKKCVNGGLTNQTNAQDLYTQCTAGYTGCAGAANTNGICVKTASGDLCDGSGACAAGSSANVANLKVCSGGSEVNATTSLYASIANSCTAASCTGTQYYRSCNGSGVTRTDNTGAATLTINANAGQSYNTSCVSGANGNPGVKCQKCNGSGGLTVQASNEDLYNQCASGNCATGYCNGTTAACQSSGTWTCPQVCDGYKLTNNGCGNCAGDDWPGGPCTGWTQDFSCGSGCTCSCTWSKHYSDGTPCSCN